MLNTCPTVLNQSTSRLDGDRTSSASSTAERGMVKPMIRIEQQQDYRRQESRQEMYNVLLLIMGNTASAVLKSNITSYHAYQRKQTLSNILYSSEAYPNQTFRPFQLSEIHFHTVCIVFYKRSRYLKGTSNVSGSKVAKQVGLHCVTELL